MNLNDIPTDIVILGATALGSTLRLGLMYVGGIPNDGWKRELTEVIVVSLLAHILWSILPVCERFYCYITTEDINKVEINHNLMYGIFAVMGLVHNEVIDTATNILKSMQKNITNQVDKKIGQ